MSNESMKLSCAEISTLWTLYINNSMSVYVLRFFLEYVEDTEIRKLIVQAYEIASNNEEELKHVFWKEQVSLPIGFSENDVNLQAPRLFSDTFKLSYVLQMARIGLVTYGGCLASVSRKDIRNMYYGFLKRTMDIFQDATDLMLEKGLFIKKPFTAISHKTEMIDSTKYFSGINPFVYKRTLNTIEVAHLSMNIETNQIGMMLCTAFSQTAMDEEVREFMKKGKQLAKNHIGTFFNALIKEDVQAPMSSDFSISASTIAPFSDKLMMLHISVMTAAGIGNYATSAAASQRSDLVIKYEKLSAETALLAKEGADLMVKHRWLEKPPTTADRNRLSDK
ncbi:DUF3231 family protein [Sutcliffiella halmapala]|uniref:DUF3231 family protein n=1 Tax=Sutcliffiella halmapala TaxID=79882 RepID=UPI000995B0B2|nr:DUF3231 family protein [Sutcliffiella halmapala]